MTAPTSLSPQDLVPLSSVQAMWQDLASRFFENRLPPITIEWSNRLTASAGLFVSQVGPRSRWVSSAYRHGDARVIRLSAPLLLGEPETELLGTLAHEMIHQWEYDIRKRRPSHGPTFREMMDRMNESGLNISIRHQLNETVHALNRYAWKCIRCGLAYYRHRRTIVPSRHLCSHCRGALVEVSLEGAQMSRLGKVEALPQEEPCLEQLRPQQLCFGF